MPFFVRTFSHLQMQRCDNVCRIIPRCWPVEVSGFTILHAIPRERQVTAANSGRRIAVEGLQ